MVRAVEVRDRTACILGRAIDSLEECKVEQAVLTKAMRRLGAPLGIKKLPRWTELLCWSWGGAPGLPAARRRPVVIGTDWLVLGAGAVMCLLLIWWLRRLEIYMVEEFGVCGLLAWFGVVPLVSLAVRGMS